MEPEQGARWGFPLRDKDWPWALGLRWRLGEGSGQSDGWEQDQEPGVSDWELGQGNGESGSGRGARGNGGGIAVADFGGAGNGNSGRGSLKGRRDSGASVCKSLKSFASCTACSRPGPSSADAPCLGQQTPQHCQQLLSLSALLRLMYLSPLSQLGPESSPQGRRAA